MQTGGLWESLALVRASRPWSLGVGWEVRAGSRTPDTVRAVTWCRQPNVMRSEVSPGLGDMCRLLGTLQRGVSLPWQCEPWLAGSKWVQLIPGALPQGKRGKRGAVGGAWSPKADAAVLVKGVRHNCVWGCLGIVAVG